MKTFTDTERLDWFLNHDGAEFQYKVVNGAESITQWWVRWYSGDDWHIARGQNKRECINAALRGEIETY